VRVCVCVCVRVFMYVSIYVYIYKMTNDVVCELNRQDGIIASNSHKMTPGEDSSPPYIICSIVYLQNKIASKRIILDEIIASIK
jgi:hypothetical protein